MIDTVLADTRATRDLEPSTALDDDLYDSAAFLDPAVLGWSLGAESPMDAVLQVAERLRQEGRYSDDDDASASRRAAGPGFLLTDAVGRQRRAVRRGDGADGQPAEGAGPGRGRSGAARERRGQGQRRGGLGGAARRRRHLADPGHRPLHEPPAAAARRRAGRRSAPTGSSPRRRPTTSRPSSAPSRSSRPTSSRPTSPTTTDPDGRARRGAADLAVCWSCCCCSRCPASCRP